MAAKEEFRFIIGAKDASGPVLRGVLGGLKSFGSAGAKALSAPFRALTSLRSTGLQSSIQLLSGFSRQLNGIIERGSRLQVVETAFGRLTGASRSRVRGLAKDLQDAAAGTITLKRSMEIANRAISSGLSLGDTKTALEFISKKAFTTGKSAAQAINTVITGLARGSTLFLDDFGILVDGTDGVRKDFDRIRSSGAFDQLGPAAQKAEIIRAAMKEMREQLGSLGVTGRESAFVFERIKTFVTDIGNDIAKAVAGSKGFGNILKFVAQQSQSIATVFKTQGFGAGIKQALASVGSVLGSFFQDLADNISAALTKGVLSALLKIQPSLSSFAKNLQNVVNITNELQLRATGQTTAADEIKKARLAALHSKATFFGVTQADIDKAQIPGFGRTGDALKQLSADADASAAAQTRAQFGSPDPRRVQRIRNRERGLKREQELIDRGRDSATVQREARLRAQDEVGRRRKKGFQPPKPREFQQLVKDQLAEVRQERKEEIERQLETINQQLLDLGATPTATQKKPATLPGTRQRRIDAARNRIAAKQRRLAKLPPARDVVAGRAGGIAGMDALFERGEEELVRRFGPDLDAEPEHIDLVFRRFIERALDKKRAGLRKGIDRDRENLANLEGDDGGTGGAPRGTSPGASDLSAASKELLGSAQTFKAVGNEILSMLRSVAASIGVVNELEAVGSRVGRTSLGG